MKPRNATNEDLSAVRALNETALPHVNSVTLEEMKRFLRQATYFKVIEDEEKGILGFLIALKPGLDYASENYRWFSRNFDDFLYIDRIVVAVDGRGLGLGSLLYSDLIENARNLASRVTCEVNSQPPNPQSMAFHTKFGFITVGSQATEGGSKEVALMSINLG